MTERKPPSAQDLSAIPPAYTWRFGAPVEGLAASAEGAATEEGTDAELQRLRAQVQQLTAALEDVVAFALSSGDYKERAIMMHRRAVAALTSRPVSRAAQPDPPPRP